jgi:hypothetical protein
VFKIRNGKMKNHINLEVISDVHNYDSRASARNDFNVNNDLHSKEFYRRAARAFNNLIKNVKKFNSINLFKSRLKE